MAWCTHLQIRTVGELIQITGNTKDIFVRGSRDVIGGVVECPKARGRDGS